MQTGAATPSHDLSSGFEENKEGNKAFDETAAASNVGNFSQKNYSQSLSLPCPWKARSCARLALDLLHLGQMHPPAFLCRALPHPAFVI